MNLQIFEITKKDNFKHYELIKTFPCQKVELYPTVGEHIVLFGNIYKVKAVYINLEHNTYNIHVRRV